MTSTKKDILEWVKERLASVPDDAQMEVKIVMGVLARRLACGSMTISIEQYINQQRERR